MPIVNGVIVKQAGSKPTSAALPDASRSSGVGGTGAQPEGKFDAADGNIEPILNNSPNLKSLHATLRSQGRDIAWARPSEDMIGKVYDEASLNGKAGAIASVSCGTTLCEVSGTINGKQADGAGFRNTLSKPELAADMWAKGYRNMGEGYAKGRDGNEAFVTYYQREAPTEAKAGRLPSDEKN